MSLTNSKQMTPILSFIFASESIFLYSQGGVETLKNTNKMGRVLI